MKENRVKAGLFGLCVGDALGVPVEFTPRHVLKEHPVTGMTGYKVHNQPPGTWSDDSSLTFCLAESLASGFDLHDIGKRFCQWLYEKRWTPHGGLFDIGTTTRYAIERLRQGTEPVKAGLTDEGSNGNGSLMRILPMAFILNHEKDRKKRYQQIHDVSCITHGHMRSQIACGIYIHYAINILNGMDLGRAYETMKEETGDFYSDDRYRQEIVRFYRILKGDIASLAEKDIRSDGYVVSTLEASLFCLLTSSSYAETVLKAVNLGDDTDTTGAVAGGIAGIYYGFDQIPREWIDQIVKKTEIKNLADNLAASVC